jgi:hypothetical protein
VNLCDFYFYKLIGKLTVFFAASGAQLAHSTSGQFHYLRAAFSSQVKSKIGNILAKTAALRITLNIDGAPLASRSHTHPSHSQTSCLLASSLSLGVYVYYESTKRELKIRPTHDCWCDERLKTKAEDCTRLTYTGLPG